MVHKITRRKFAGCVAATPILALPDSGLESLDEAAVWTPAWDSALAASLKGLYERLYDPNFKGLRLENPSAQYHNLVGQNNALHPLRESITYAAVLFETGDEKSTERAHSILNAILPRKGAQGQNDRGLVSQFLETTNIPLDINMPSFNMFGVLIIYFRYQSKLNPEIRERILAEASRLSALVQRRSVSVYYTNIALLDLFIAMSALELAPDETTARFVRQRLNTFSEKVTGPSGGFAEYLCPTYLYTDFATVTAMRTFLKDPMHKMTADHLHDKLWKHLAGHWHAPTRQISGPMARAYSDGTGSPLWLQKGLNNRLAYKTMAQLGDQNPDYWGEAWTPILPYACPQALVDYFLSLRNSRQVREVFAPGHIIEEGNDHDPLPTQTRPVQGTSFLAPNFTLSTANQSDFWEQRRPIAAFWGSDAGPLKFLRLRVLKDDRDFASAQFYSVQADNSALGMVNFAYPSGDVSPAQSGLPESFPVTTLRVSFTINHGLDACEIIVDDTRFESQSMDIAIEHGRTPPRLAWCCGSIQACLSVVGAHFGASAIRCHLSRKPRSVAIDIYLVDSGTPKMINAREAGQAYLCFSLTIQNASGTLESFAKSELRPTLRIEEQKTVGSALYRSMKLSAGVSFASLRSLDEAFVEQVNGIAVPLAYL